MGGNDQRDLHTALVNPIECCPLSVSRLDFTIILKKNCLRLCSISTSEFSTGNLLMRMKYRAKSFIYIAIFIDLLQKCGRAIPMNTRADLKMENKPGKDKKPIPPWAKANGLGNNFYSYLIPSDFYCCDITCKHYRYTNH